MKQSALGLIVVQRGVAVAITNRRHGGFGLPGGKVEDGEEPAETLGREFQEELGIEAMCPRFLLREAWGDGRLVHVFWLPWARHSFRAVEPGTEVRLMNLGELIRESPFGKFYERAFPHGWDHLRETELL